jgi:hypothetical protein
VEIVCGWWRRARASCTAGGKVEGEGRDGDGGSEGIADWLVEGLGPETLAARGSAWREDLGECQSRLRESRGKPLKSLRAFWAEGEDEVETRREKENELVTLIVPCTAAYREASKVWGWQDHPKMPFYFKGRNERVPIPCCRT